MYIETKIIMMIMKIVMYILVVDDSDNDSKNTYIRTYASNPINRCGYGIKFKAPRKLHG